MPPTSEARTAIANVLSHSVHTNLEYYAPATMSRAHAQQLVNPSVQMILGERVGGAPKNTQRCSTCEHYTCTIFQCKCTCHQPPQPPPQREEVVSSYGEEEGQSCSESEEEEEEVVLKKKSSSITQEVIHISSGDSSDTEEEEKTKVTEYGVGQLQRSCGGQQAADNHAMRRADWRRRRQQEHNDVDEAPSFVCNICRYPVKNKAGFVSHAVSKHFITKKTLRMRQLVNKSIQYNNPHYTAPRRWI